MMTLRTRTLAPAAAAALMLSVPAAAADLVIGMPTTPPNVVHMPVILAKDLGLYKKYGIEVDSVALDGGVKVFRAMLAGNVDVAAAPGALTTIAVAKGSKVKAVVANLTKFEASLVVRGDIKTMADLKGKRIGIQQPGGFADVLSRSVLKAAKINANDVHFVSIATEDVPALVANQVDTAILHVEQEMFARTKVPDLHAIARMWELQPKTLYQAMVVKDETIRSKAKGLDAFVKANIEATRILYTERAKVLPLIVKHTGYPEKVVADTYDFLVKNCIWDANSGIGPERVNFTADLMTKIGNIPQGKTPKYEDVVDVSFAKDAIKALGEWKGPVCPTAAF